MVTGRKTFEGKSQASIIAAILDRDPPPISSIEPMTPRHLDHVVRRCLAKTPEERWQTALDLHMELKLIAEEPPETLAPAAAPRALQFVEPHCIVDHHYCRCFSRCSVGVEAGWGKQRNIDQPPQRCPGVR